VVLGDARKAHHEVTLDHVVSERASDSAEWNWLEWDVRSEGSSHPYVEEHLTIEWRLAPTGVSAAWQIRHRERAGSDKAVASDYPVAAVDAEWVNVRTLGAKGDGRTIRRRSRRRSMASGALFP